MNAVTSILDQMAAGVMARKQEAAKGTLTTLPGEVAVASVEDLLPTTKAMFPNDHPAESIEQIVITLQRQMTHLQEVVDALNELVGKQADTEVVTVDPKAAEKAADATAAETFAAKFAAQQAEAQAATFAPVEDPDEWTCPTHKMTKTSPKGRVFCPSPGCHEAE